METLDGAELCFPELLNTSCRKKVRPHSEAMLFYILLSCVSVLTVALNVLVIISISHFRQRHTPTNLLLLSLAVSDLLAGLLLPVEILFSGACWLYGDFVCTLSFFVVLSVISVSVGNMVLISVDRYVAICYPLHYPTKMNQTRVRIYACLCWICALFYSSLILKDQLKQPGMFHSCVGECVVVFNYIAGTVDLVFNFIVPITVIVVLYMRVFVVAVSQARAMRSQTVAVTHQRPGTVTAKKSEMKAARTLGVVIFVFLMCYCPYYCFILAGNTSLVSASSLDFFTLLVYLNSCLNPVIYAFFYPWFRKSIKLIVTLQILQPGSRGANLQ
ncbi:trace amine-associated receptor 13c-like [Myripristis murdjan]|uniref:trace amine-associated receptor 13c-like n=1 Tax=Myripristis murdjan TaxID=586833 RepID=UPI001175E1F2|nr:trace amine-associated receptor 13c-like [Myripristis murdjan]